MTFEEWMNGLDAHELAMVDARIAFYAGIKQEREACAEEADDHGCDTWPECCNCSGKIATAIRRRDSNYRS